MGFIASFFKSVLSFFSDVWEFFSNGIYDFAIWAFAGFIEMATLAYLKFQLWSLQYAWDTAVSLINSSNIIPLLSQAWLSVPPQFAGILSLLQIPAFISIIVTAFVTKIVLKFIPFANL